MKWIDFHPLEIALIVLGVGGAYWLGGSRGPEVQYRRVKVPVEKIREVEKVDTVVSWRERVVYRTVRPEVVATADSGAVPDVASFCAQAVESALSSIRPDTVLQVDTVFPAPQLLLRSIRTEPGWFFSPDRAILTGPLSSGDLWQGTYWVRPGWQGRVMADSMLVQSPRWWWVRNLIETAAILGVGYVAGKVLP